MSTPESIGKRYIALLILVNLSIPIFVFLQHAPQNVSIWTGWLSAITLSGTFLLGIYFRRRRAGQQTPPMLFLYAGALAILSGLITTATSHKQPNSYLELINSNTPLNEIEPERKRLLVELGRRNAANSAANSRAAGAMKPISPPLFSVRSFASKATMESTLSQLERAYELDRAYATAMDQSAEDFRDKMLKVDPDYLRQFESAENDYSTQQAAIESAEESWVRSTSELYNYSIAHADVISVDQSDDLIIENPEVRKTLLQQIDKSKDLEQKLQDARSKALEIQRKAQD